MSQGIKRKRLSSTVKPRKKLVSRSDAVRGDSLRWKEVSVSKHLDDAEGFFGLEELSDVEVVKDENGKGVLFKPTVDKADSAIEQEKSTDADNWAGFDDEGSADHVQTEAGDAPAAVLQDSESPAREDKLQKKHHSRDMSTSFESLSDDVRFDLLNGVDVAEAENDMSAWYDLDLSPPITNALSALKFSAPTKIQRASIPSIVSGQDVIGKAVTGSGKTLAFGIPVIERWLDLKQPRTAKSAEHHVHALVLAPTRELAHQISSHLTAVCENLDLAPRVTTVTGGLSVLKQQRQLSTADIVVATPGRLWEVISGSNELLESFKNLRFLVIDEADRLLSEGHFQEVEDILDALDRRTVDEDDEDEGKHPGTVRQTLVFSATFHKGLQQKLASKQKRRADKESNLLSDKQSMEYLMQKLPFQKGQKPTFVDANPDSQMAENLSETILECKAMEKDLYLYTFLLQQQHLARKLASVEEESKVAPRILVFTNSVSAVKRLVPLLQSLELPATSISPLHSNMPQKSRLRSLERFSGTDSNPVGKHMTSILIATDVAARGLDIKGIATIVHYHVPRTADAYVHRSGRTARVNSSGSSILLCSPDETASVTKLIAKLHSNSNGTSAKDISKIINRKYLPNDLLRQVGNRIDLAQRLVESSQSTEKVKSEDNWLRSAAEELGVDYDSEEFENAEKQARRGRGGGRDRKQKKAAEQENRKSKVGELRVRLKEDLQRRVDFGDGAGRNMKYLAGGAFDVNMLLAERENI